MSQALKTYTKGAPFYNVWNVQPTQRQDVLAKLESAQCFGLVPMNKQNHDVGAPVDKLLKGRACRQGIELEMTLRSPPPEPINQNEPGSSSTGSSIESFYSDQ
jgi:hypothetical protein